MKEKNFKNLLLNLIKEKENINILISCQSLDDINNNIIKIPTTIIESKISDILKEKNIIPSVLKNFNMDFLENSLIINISAIPSKLIGQVDISFSIKIKDIFVSKNNIKIVCGVYEYLDKKTPVIKKMAINTFTKNHSILETVLNKTSLPESIKFTSEKNDFTFFVTSSLLQNLSNLELKFKKCDKNFFYFDFKVLEDSAKTGDILKKTNIKTGSISSMLNYSDRF